MTPALAIAGQVCPVIRVSSQPFFALLALQRLHVIRKYAGAGGILAAVLGPP